MKLLQKQICTTHVFTRHIIVLPDPPAVLPIALRYAGAIMVTVTMLTTEAN